MIAIDRTASSQNARGGRCGPATLCCLIVCLALAAGSSAALAQNPPAAPAKVLPGAKAMPAQPLSKSQALDSTINALVLNGSPPAMDSLRKLVTGEITTNGLDREAARSVLTRFAMLGTPEGEALILEVICNAEQVRPEGRGGCTAENLREDAVEILSTSASPSIRTALAARYADPQTSKEGKEAIATIFKAPLPENIAFQVQLLSQAGADAEVKQEILAALATANEAAVKQALGLEAEGSAAPGGMPAGMPNMPPGTTALPPGMRVLPPGMKELPPGMNELPPGMSAKGMPPGMPTPPPGMLASPKSIPGSKLAGSLFGSLRRVFVADGAGGGGDPSNPTQALWSAEFADALAKQLAADEAGRPEMLGFLASLPAKAPRAKLHAFLEKSWSEGPTGLAGASKEFKLALNEPAEKAPRKKKIGKRGDDEDDRKRGGLVLQNGAQGAGKDAPEKVENKIESFGENWFDPGALVVLKSFSYLDRPRDKKTQRADQPNFGAGGGALNLRRGDDEPAADPKSSKLSAAQKREQEKEAKQKVLESRYDWRDAIERYIHVLNGRFESVAEQPAPTEPGVEPAAAESAPADAKAVAKADTKGGEKPGSAAKLTLEGMSFPLHEGAEVVKEFRGHWPAPSGPGAAIVEPMTVHYVRIEGEAPYGKVVSHYKAAIKTKKPSMLRDIEEGRWIDAMQEGSTPDRDRSVDVFVTHTAEPGEVKKVEPIVVEILTVEIPHVGPAKSAPKGTASTP